MLILLILTLLTPPRILLWLDDVRNPTDPRWDVYTTKFDSDSIVWVKNYSEFSDWISHNGLPYAISFDHDLASEHYVPGHLHNDYNASKEYQDSKQYIEKTGNDCAKWLIDYCALNSQRLPRWAVHSFNPVGADNIRGTLNQAHKHLGL